MQKDSKYINHCDKDLFRIGFSFSEIYPDVNEFKDNKKYPNTNIIKKIQSKTITDLYENFNSDLNFECIIETWNKYVPNNYPSFREILKYLEYNEDAKYKIVKRKNGLQIQQIA